MVDEFYGGYNRYFYLKYIYFLFKNFLKELKKLNLILKIIQLKF